MCADPGTGTRIALSLGAALLLLFGTVAAGAEPPPKTRDFAAAARLYRQHRFHEAGLAFEAGWARHQEGPFLFNAAMAYEKARRPVQAIRLLEAYASRYPADAGKAATAMERLARVVGKTHGRLEVRPEPPAATVTIGGEARSEPVWLVAGEGVDVLVRLDGHRPATRRVTLSAGERAVLVMPLEPLPRVGALVVESEPPGALVLVDGVERGVTPVRVDALEVGEHEVELRSSHGATLRKVTTEESRTATLMLALAPASDPRPGPAPPPVVVEPVPLAKRWWFWTLIGAGVAGVATAAILLSTAGDEVVRQPAPGPDWVWGTER